MRFGSCAAALLALAGARAAAGAQAAAQRPAASAAECPIAGGVTASVTVRDSARAAPRDLLRVDRRTAVDTTFVFNVRERRWTVAELGASAAAGLADTVRGRWYLCAGAAVGLHDPTLVIRGARGRVHLRASLRDLFLAPGPGQQNRAPSTPPTKS